MTTSDAIVFVSFMFVAVGALAAGLIARQTVLCWVAGLFWMFLGVTSYAMSGKDESNMDVYMAIWMLSFVMLIASFGLGVSVKNKEQAREEKDERDKRVAADNARRLTPLIIKRLREERRDRKEMRKWDKG